MEEAEGEGRSLEESGRSLGDSDRGPGDLGNSDGSLDAGDMENENRLNADDVGVARDVDSNDSQSEVESVDGEAGGGEAEGEHLTEAVELSPDNVQSGNHEEL